MTPLDVTDDASALVFADWLQQQGNPWGELIAMQVRGLPCAEQVHRLAPPLARFGSAITWKHGLVERLQIGADPDPAAIATAAREVLALPIAGRLEAIAFAPLPAMFEVWRSWDGSMEHVVDPWGSLRELAALVPARVTKVGFGPRPACGAAAYVYLPSLAEISQLFPRTTELVLVGLPAATLGRLELPRLQALTLRLALANDDQLRELAAAALPELERLELGLGGTLHGTVDEVHAALEWTEVLPGESRYPDSYSARDIDLMGGYSDSGPCDATAARIAAVIEGAYPKLRHLSLASSVITGDHLDRVLRSPRIARLSTLNLSGCMLTDETIPTIVADPASLAHLEVVDLSRNRFTEAGRRTLRDALPNAVITNERPGLELVFRYLATME